MQVAEKAKFDPDEYIMSLGHIADKKITLCYVRNATIDDESGAIKAARTLLSQRCK